jgi:hypothetical protein
MPKIARKALFVVGIGLMFPLPACGRNAAWDHGIERPLRASFGCPGSPEIERTNMRRSLLMVVAGARAAGFTIHSIDTEQSAVYTEYRTVRTAIPMALVARVRQGGEIELAPAPGSPWYTGRALVRVENETRRFLHLVGGERCKTTAELEALAQEIGVVIPRTTP